MSFGRCFDAIAACYGETITVERGGEVLGSGRALLRPLGETGRQFVPSPLGVGREERLLCLGENALPLEPGDGPLVVCRGGERYDVLRAVRAGRSAYGPTYWRAELKRRETEAVP